MSSRSGADGGSPSSSPTCAAGSTKIGSAPHATVSSCSSEASAARRFREWPVTPTATHTGAFAGAATRAQAAWQDLGRPGRPRLWGQGYFALGDVERGNAYLRDYYAFAGPFAERIVAANLTSARAIKDFVRGYEEAGCDELVLFPTVAELDELKRLAETLA